MFFDWFALFICRTSRSTDYFFNFFLSGTVQKVYRCWPDNSSWLAGVYLLSKFNLEKKWGRLEEIDPWEMNQSCQPWGPGSDVCPAYFLTISILIPNSTASNQNAFLQVLRSLECYGTIFINKIKHELQNIPRIYPFSF